MNSIWSSITSITSIIAPSEKIDTEDIPNDNAPTMSVNETSDRPPQNDVTDNVHASTEAPICVDLSTDTSSSVIAEIMGESDDPLAFLSDRSEQTGALNSNSIDPPISPIWNEPSTDVVDAPSTSRESSSPKSGILAALFGEEASDSKVSAVQETSTTDKPTVEAIVLEPSAVAPIAFCNSSSVEELNEMSATPRSIDRGVDLEAVNLSDHSSPEIMNEEATHPIIESVEEGVVVAEPETTKGVVTALNLSDELSEELSDEEYVVEKVEQFRIWKGVEQFKIKWENYDERSWEPATCSEGFEGELQKQCQSLRNSYYEAKKPKSNNTTKATSRKSSSPTQVSPRKRNALQKSKESPKEVALTSSVSSCASSSARSSSDSTNAKKSSPRASPRKSPIPKRTSPKRSSKSSSPGRLICLSSSDGDEIEEDEIEEDKSSSSASMEVEILSSDSEEMMEESPKRLELQNTNRRVQSTVCSLVNDDHRCSPSMDEPSPRAKRQRSPKHQKQPERMMSDLPAQSPRVKRSRQNPKGNKFIVCPVTGDSVSPKDLTAKLNQQIWDIKQVYCESTPGMTGNGIDFKFVVSREGDEGDFTFWLRDYHASMEEPWLELSRFLLTRIAQDRRDFTE